MMTTDELNRATLAAHTKPQWPRPVHTSPEVALAVTLAALALYDDRSTFVHYAEDDAFSVDPDFDL